MNPDAILEPLRTVRALRERRAADPAHGARVRALKAWQARRFERTYADLLARPATRGAARFFLDELYGPQPFERRDAQFMRIVPTSARVFPREVVATMAQLAELHALSERLDDATAAALPPGVGSDGGAPIDAAAYMHAWRGGSQPAERERQIAATLELGRRMQRHTSHRGLRTMLRMMRAPAAAAGLGALQSMLESGFDAYAALGAEADRFLATIGERERAIAAALDAAARAPSPSETPASPGAAASGAPAPWNPDAPLALLP